MKNCSVALPGPLRAAMRARGLRWALVALLLFAQHSALVHALAHAGWQAHSGSAKASVSLLVHEGGAPSKQAAPLCAFDQVYSQVLGVVLDTAAGFRADTGNFVRQDWRTCTRIVAVLPPFLSRGPPALL